MSTPGKQLRFAPFSSFLDTGFWYRLSENKLNVYGLSDSPKKIHGFYYNGDPPGLPCRMCLDHAAFESQPQTPKRYCSTSGVLHNTNTLEMFKEIDKQDLLDQVAKEIWDDIKTGRAIDDPGKLTRFILLTFADLKKYHYYYWFAFPCLSMPSDVQLGKCWSLNDRFSEKQMNGLLQSYDEFQQQKQHFQGYFVIAENGEKLTVHHLSEVKTLLEQSIKILFAFCDPCTMDTNPGWPLRNYLVLISVTWGVNLSEVETLCFRDRVKNGVRSITHSIVLSLQLPTIGTLSDVPKHVGWEKNERHKMGPRMVNLSSSMDPFRLAESSVDLNLKLMRWRLIPNLKLEKICGTKCLLLGSGTLGCGVARCLLGWGVRTITLVDNSRISYSNPVRQSLFTFEDSLHGGKEKAMAAAAALQKIFPGVNTTGINLSIPMPGHHVTDNMIEQTKQDIAQLEELIDVHDAIFLLMDTRESRWLPTLLGAAKDKIVITAALGFDTFLVLRHGFGSSPRNYEITNKALGSYIPGNQLGCYFCSDVVAPGDSTKDRTLDQQCTVTRPGMSMIASALAVELLTSLLQHPDGPLAPVDISAKDDHMTQDSDSSLGIIPHQIRGFLSRYHIVLPAGRAFAKCTGCSDKVINCYRKEGFDFFMRVFNEPTYLEDLTGLTQMHKETFDADVIELSDDDDDDDDDGETLEI